jgi:DNA polymerase-3 subunit delta
MDSPAVEKPVVILLRGDDPLAMERMISDLVSRISDDPVTADMNLVRLDGRSVSDQDLRNACYSLPFLATRRLVVLRHLLARFLGDTDPKDFLRLLEGLPESTAVVLLVDDEKDYHGEWKGLNSKHWLMKWIAEKKRPCLVRECALPRPAEMPDWLRKEARRQGGEMSLEAARALADHVGNETLMATQEINKLLTYTKRQRPVEAEDVEELCAPGGGADIFTMVDALVCGDAKKAQHLLHRLLEEQDAAGLFGMVVRQFRMLIQTREILDEGGGASQVLADGVTRSYSLAQLLVRQVVRFTLPELLDIYRRLLEMDAASKVSQGQLDLELDLLIVDLAQRAE